MQKLQNQNNNLECIVCNNPDVEEIEHGYYCYICNANFQFSSSLTNKNPFKYKYISKKHRNRSKIKKEDIIDVEVLESNKIDYKSI